LGDSIPFGIAKPEPFTLTARANSVSGSSDSFRTWTKNSFCDQSV
jgi:hypothetical protein